MTADKALCFGYVMRARATGSAERLTGVSIRYALKRTAKAASRTLLAARCDGAAEKAELANLSEQLRRRRLFRVELLATWKLERGGALVEQIWYLVPSLPTHWINRLGAGFAQSIASNDVEVFLAVLRRYPISAGALESVEALPGCYSEALVKYAWDRQAVAGEIVR
jgi:hypothetical protein